jgi:HIRAN domain
MRSPRRWHDARDHTPLALPKARKTAASGAGFLAAWAAGAAAAFLVAAAAPAQNVRLLVQSSPLAGFGYHEAAAVWKQLAVGDRLDLVREPANAHDPNAVRVEWHGRKLGYVPRAENAALAWAMDRGERVSARISVLREHKNPRQRVEFEVFVE